jgi:hypothetical protein
MDPRKVGQAMAIVIAACVSAMIMALTIKLILWIL